MFFLRANETLYLNTWNYNAALILEELRQIITNNGGRIQATTPGNVVNRTILECIQESREKAAHVRARIESGEIETTEARAAYIAAREKEAAELEAMPNDPRPVSGGSYIRFIIENTCYYISMPDNPFFEAQYIKTPINAAGKISKDAAIEELEKDFMWDCFFSLSKPATDDDRREAANLIFNQLMRAKNSVIIRDRTRRRVSNTYNSGYHYETITAPERMETVTF